MQAGTQAGNLIAVFNGLTVDLLPLPVVETFPLTITPAVSPATGDDLAWASEIGTRYNLRTSTDLSTPISTWTLVQGDIAATPPTNPYNVPSDGPRRFYAVDSFPAPPVTVLSESFDTTAALSLPAGWTAGKNNPPDTASLTNWELGTPSNVGPVPPGVLLPSAPHCIGTNISGDYDSPGGSGAPYTDIWLRSAPIDLTGRTSGTLTLKQWTQIEAAAGDLDYGSIRILDASNGAELAVLENRRIDAST